MKSHPAFYILPLQHQWQYSTKHSRRYDLRNCLPLKRMRRSDYERRNLNYDNLLMITRLRLAGREGFEPSIPDPKSGALPLGDRPISKLLERSSSGPGRGSLNRFLEPAGSHPPQQLSHIRRSLFPLTFYAFRY
jgi:hypothetical protein